MFQFNGNNEGQQGSQRQDNQSPSSVFSSDGNEGHQDNNNPSNSNSPNSISGNEEGQQPQQQNDDSSSSSSSSSSDSSFDMIVEDVRSLEQKQCGKRDAIKLEASEALGELRVAQARDEGRSKVLEVNNAYEHHLRNMLQSRVNQAQQPLLLKTCHYDPKEKNKDEYGFVYLIKLPNGKFAAAKGREVYIWDVETWKCFRFNHHKRDNFFDSPVLLANGNLAIDDGSMTLILNLETRRVTHGLNVKKHKFVKTCGEFEFNHVESAIQLNDSRLFTLSWNKELLIWDLDKEECTHFDSGEVEYEKLFKLSNGGVVAFDGKCLSTLNMEDMKAMKTFARMDRYDDFLSPLANNCLALAREYDGIVLEIWDADTGECVRTKQLNAKNDGQNGLCGMWLLADEKLAVYLTREGSRVIEIYDTKENNLKHVQTLGDSTYSNLMVDDFKQLSANFVAVASEGNINIWNLTTGRCAQTIKHEGVVALEVLDKHLVSSSKIDVKFM